MAQSHTHKHKHTQLDKYFTFEVQVLDDKNIRRRFRASTFQVY
jgi:hypothetical protein